MKRRFFLGLLVAVLGLNLFFGTRLYLSYAETAAQENAYENIELFTRVLETIRQNYVDGGKISYQQLIHAALRGMVSSLDPHSEFMEARKYDDMRKDTEGAFGGVGIVLGVRTNSPGKGMVLTVSETMEDTPAGRGGITAGDRIIKINGQSTEKFNLEDAVRRLRGKPGTDVTVTIFRPATQQESEIKLTRAVIKVASVRDQNGRGEYPLDENKIGYARLRQFGEQTSAELESALVKMEKAGMKGFIMDLRDNPGGLLDQAVKVSEKFLPRGQLIVSTEARQVADSAKYTASGRNSRTVPMVILMNGGSASASEIVAGCLQDLKRAVVLGEQSFGKGSVQSILPLSDGSALRLTTAKYYTPSHKVIHEKGITPDVVVPMSAEEERHLAIKRSGAPLDALDEKERALVTKARDPQFDRATDMLKGILLYDKQGKPVGKVAAQATEPAKK
ncbi:MAG: S41 family peptidase [Limisphaerales bacterium]